jgi:hypothetical protein
VIGGQVSVRVADGERLLRAHHKRIGKAAKQHDKPQSHVHNADALVVDAGQPLAPQIGPPALHGDDSERGQNNHGDAGAADQR